MYISPEERQKIIDNNDISIIVDGISKNNKLFRQCTKSTN